MHFGPERLQHCSAVLVWNKDNNENAAPKIDSAIEGLREFRRFILAIFQVTFEEHLQFAATLVFISLENGL